MASITEMNSAVFCALAIGLPVVVAASDLDALNGRFAFNWLPYPAKEKCSGVDDKRLEAFRSPPYRRDLTPSPIGSGALAVKCGRRDGKVEYLIFATRAASETERQAQAANGD